MIRLNGHIIEPTMFPDKTSQVWKLPVKLFEDHSNIVSWEFESESEFMHLAQLKMLLDNTASFSDIKLEMNYLPYARQDKEVANNATFALIPFANLLNSLKFKKIAILDPHNKELTLELINNSFTVDADCVIEKLLKDTESTLCFPDKGASHRYDLPKHTSRMVVFDKVREPSTGDILGVKPAGIVYPTKYLIVDDLCDGGRTFIEVAKSLYEAGATEVNLYVSHGIFSKGTQVLRDAGIKRIFTYKGEIK